MYGEETEAELRLARGSGAVQKMKLDDFWEIERYYKDRLADL